MVSKQIEDIAAHTVSLYFSKSNTVSPYIATNDKEPCWDGNLYLYTNPDKTNASLYGRIPVQVKGKTFKSEKIKDEIKYTVSYVNLNNYKRDGGILYFVVGIWNNCERIYYAELTPLRLNHYIKQCNGKASCSIKLSLLGEYTPLLDYKIRDFYENCKHQSNNTDDTIKLETLNAPGKEVNLSFFASEIKDTNVSIPQYLSRTPVYLYANLTDEFNNSILRPVGEGRFKIQVNETVPATIKTNGIVYYKEYKRLYKSDGSVVISIGEALKLELFPNNSQSPKMSFNIKEKDINTWIKEAEFVIDIIQTNSLEIDGIQMNLKSCGNTQYESWFKERLSYLKKIQELLAKLNINIPLALKEFSEEEENTLDVLYRAICQNQEISLKEEPHPLFTVDISNLCIALSCSKTPSGKYRLFTYKDLQEAVFYRDANTTTPLRTSIYSWFQKEGFLSVCNIDYDDIVPSYQKIRDFNPNISQRANNDMLMMLLAYDEDNNERTLKAAASLCRWLLSIQDEKDKHTYLLNMMQIIKRERQLNLEERETLMDLVDSVDLMGKVACYILLDNREQAEHYIKKLSKKEVAFFKSLPIYNLYNSKNHSDV